MMLRTRNAAEKPVDAIRVENLSPADIDLEAKYPLLHEHDQLVGQHDISWSDVNLRVIFV